MSFAKYIHKGACVALTLVFKAVIENDVRLCCPVGDVADWPGQLRKFVAAVIVVEAGRSSCGTVRTPRICIATMQPYKREVRIGYLPHTRRARGWSPPLEHP